MADEALQPNIELKASLSKDEAVAMLMGWISGYTRPAYIRANEQGVSADHSFFLPALEGSLEKYLAALRADTYQEFLDSFNADASVDELNEKEKAIERCNALIKQAWNYSLDISDEISNGEASLLKIDPEATEKFGIKHYTIRSIERWAESKYPNADTTTTSSMPVAQNASGRSAIGNRGNYGENNGRTSKAVDSLKTTFAFLVEAFVESTPSSYRHSDDGANVAVLSRKLEQLAEKANKGLALEGQGQESIRKRIFDAMSAKKKVLGES